MKVLLDNFIMVNQCLLIILVEWGGGLKKLEHKDWLIKNDPEDVKYYLALGLTWKKMYGLV